MIDATGEGPRIVVTVAVAAAQTDPVIAGRKNVLYAEAVARHGAEPVILDATSSAEVRAAAFATMDGLLLSGGPDLDPVRYGRALTGSAAVEPDRDALEAEAWSAAVARSVPVLGLCRGFQAINVFSGGTLLQHVEGHNGSSWGRGPAATHPLRLEAGSALASFVGSDGPLVVNSYHHQGIRPHDLAPGLVASAWADSSAGPLIEGLETADGRFVIGVQCHPERNRVHATGLRATVRRVRQGEPFRVELGAIHEYVSDDPLAGALQVVIYQPGWWPAHHPTVVGDRKA